jgi:hypothetical protein
MLLFFQHKPQKTQLRLNLQWIRTGEPIFVQISTFRKQLSDPANIFCSKKQTEIVKLVDLTSVQDPGIKR